MSKVSYGCPVFKQNNIKQSTKVEVKIEDESLAVKVVAEVPLRLCLECPLPECQMKKRDDKKEAKIGDKKES